jgi:drug/metabolite transporter (DMT)-like permease
VSPAARGRAWVLATAVLWSLGGVLIRTGERVGVTPEAMACLRSAVAGIALSWALPAIRPALGGRFVVAAGFYVMALFPFVIATASIGAAEAIFLQYFYPLLVAVGARLLYRESIGARGLVALAVGTAGVGVILANSLEKVGGIGLTWGLGSAVGLGGFILVQRGMKAGNPIGLTAAYNLITAAVLLAPAIGHLRLSPQGWALVVVTGLFQVGLAYVCLLRGLRHVGAAEASILCFVEPVLNPLWVWLALREVPPTWTLIGGALILSAVLLRLTGAAARPAPDSD